MSLREQVRFKELVGLGSTLVLLLSAACAEHSDRWEQAECIPGASDKPPCPQGTICLEEDWTCHALCGQSSSECDSAVEACFLPEGVCKVYRAECDPANPSCMEGFYCDASGACTKRLSQGSKCGDSDECWSGACANGVCCEDSCSDPCVACVESLTGQADGRCEPILSGMMPPAPCPDYTACDGTGHCFAKPLGSSCGADTECSSLHCADNVCCDAACDGLCQACTAALSGGADGTCTPIPAGKDPDLECNQYGCNGAGRCIQGAANGAACGDDGQCDSGFCVDDVCCESVCAGTCEACSADFTESSNGTCAAVPELADPAMECAGNFGCDGARACIPPMQWQGASTIEVASSWPTKPRLTVDRHGNVIVVWAQSVDGPLYYDALAIRYQIGSGWGLPTLLERDETTNVAYIDVASNHDGDATAVWMTENSDNVREIRAARYLVDQGAWELSVGLDTGGLSLYPDGVSMNTAGDIVVVWWSGATIKSASFEAGVGWRYQQTVVSFTDLYSYTTAPGMDESGIAYVAWISGSSWGKGDVWASRRPAGGEWEPAIQIDGPTTKAFEGKLATTDAGDVFVTWYTDSTPVEIWVAHRTEATGWTEPFQLGAAPDGGAIYYPAVAAATGPHAVVAWDEHGAGGTRLLARRYAPDAGWSTAVPVPTGPNGGALPDIAMDLRGNAILVWNVGDQGVWSSRSTPAGGWDAPVAIDSGRGGVNPYVRVAAGAGGQAAAAWLQGVGGDLDAWSNVFR